MNNHYRPTYYQALDLITTYVKNRFEQPGYKTYLSVRNLILKAAAMEPYEAELQHVLDFYGTDYDHFLLNTNLEIICHSLVKEKDKKVSLTSVLEFFEDSVPHILQSMSQVVHLVQLMLVMPATNTV